MEYSELIKLSKEASKSAHAPYSGFHVGAALLTADNKVITGCNIESSSFSLTICAERTAIFKAYSEGIKKFKAIAVTSDSPDYCPPCGACRQVISDLCGDIDVVMSNSENELKIIKISELLPFAFNTNYLDK